MCLYKLTIITFFCKPVDAIIEEVPSGPVCCSYGGIHNVRVGFDFLARASVYSLP